MEKPTVSELFPLRLSPFEEYLYKDDRPAYPMVFAIRLRTSGELDPDRLGRAATAVVSRHPLLQSTIRKIGWNRHEWVHDRNWRPPVAVTHPEPDREYPRSQLVSILHQPPLKLEVLPRSEGHELCVHFHHSSCDGIGSFQFIRDLLIAYHVDANARELLSRLPPLSVALLRKRAVRERSWAEWLKSIPDELRGIAGARKFFCRFPRSVTRQTFPDMNGNLPADYPLTFVRRLTREQVTRLRNLAHNSNATTYELMLRELYLALREFCRANDPLRPGDWLRLTVPINLREAAHQEMPATNVVSMVFLDRRHKHFDDSDRLLQTIHGEMWRIKRFDVKYAFVKFAHLLACFPWTYDLMSRSRKCHGTALLTNIGRVLHDLPLPYDDGRVVLNGVCVESIDFVPPYRALSSTSFSLIDYAEEFHLTLHYDPHGITSEQAESLINKYVDRLRGL